jgi:hypothetical protein
MVDMVDALNQANDTRLRLECQEVGDDWLLDNLSALLASGEKKPRPSTGAGQG